MPESVRSGETGKRVGTLLGYSAAVVASLLTFPAAIPWMIAFWQFLFCFCLFTRISPLWPVLTSSAILVAKGTSLDPRLLALLFQVAVAIYVTHSRRLAPGRRHSAATCAGLIGGWGCWLFFTVGWNHSSQSLHESEDRAATVVCFGDSLTLNEDRTGGYPEVLQTLVDRSVVNLGQPGISTVEALPKLEELKRLKPGIVVIELGGHDFLKGKSRAEAKENLEQMIAVSRGLGAEVILFEIPRGFIYDPWWGLEREIAREQRVRLISDSVIRLFVLYSPFAPPGMWTAGPYLSDDGLHPNKNGNVEMAKAVARAISGKDER